MPDRELEWDFWDKCFWKLNALKLPQQFGTK